MSMGLHRRPRQRLQFVGGRSTEDEVSWAVAADAWLVR
jgi:hypothetical protein